MRQLPQKILTFLKKRWKLILLLVLIGGGVWFWQSRQAAAQQKKITYATVERGTVKKTLQISGTIDAKERARQRFIACGEVMYLGAKEGDRVKKWQTLAKIDTRDLEKRLSQDLNTYFNQRMDFEQGRADMKDKATTTKDERTIQKDQKNLENKVLDVEVRDIAIRNAVLSSPIDGILITAPTSVPGVNLLATDVFDVVNPQTLYLKATVDERDISVVKIGQPVSIVLDAYPDRTFESRVTSIKYQSSETSTGTVFVVEVPLPVTGFDNPLEMFRLGMNGDVDILLSQSENVIKIPTAAVKSREGKSFVEVKTVDGKTQKTTAAEREIKVGVETDDVTEVVSGLQPGEEVVVP